MQSPFDLRIAGERAGAGAGCVDQDAIKYCAKRYVTGIRRNDVDVGFANELFQQSGTAGVKFHRNNSGMRILLREYPRLSPRRGTAIENPCGLVRKLSACEQRDQLRSF